MAAKVVTARRKGDGEQLPFWLELLKDFALCMVADSTRLDEAVQV
jgi:hypothetical protein